MVPWSDIWPRSDRWFNVPYSDFLGVCGLDEDFLAHSFRRLLRFDPIIGTRGMSDPTFGTSGDHRPQTTDRA